MSAVILEVFNVPSDVDYGVDIVKRRPGADPSTSTVTRLWRKWLKLRGRGLPQAGRAADGSGQFGRWARGEAPAPATAASDPSPGISPGTSRQGCILDSQRHSVGKARPAASL